MARLGRAQPFKPQTRAFSTTLLPPMANLQDEFNFGGLDSGKWFTWGTVTTQATTNLDLEITSVASGTDYGGIISLQKFNLTGSYAFAQLLDAGSQVSGLEVYPVELSSGSNALSVMVSANVVYARQKIAGSYATVGSTVAYNSTTMKWFRVRESGGSIFWEYATDPTSTWTQIATGANPFNITSMAGGITLGTWSAVAVTTAKYDNFNVLPNSLEFTWQGFDWHKRIHIGQVSFNQKFSTNNVSGPDGSNYMTVTLSNPAGGNPVGAEFFSDKRGWGYGIYTTIIGTQLNTLNPQVGFGGMFTFDFTAPPDYKEIDVDETRNYNANPNIRLLHSYVWNNGGVRNFIVDDIDVTADVVQTHQLIWTPGQIIINSYVGAGTTGTLIRSTVATTHIPTAGLERVHFNIWAFDSVGSENAPTTAVVIQSFSFAALSNTAILTSLQATKNSTTAVLTTLESHATKSTAAIFTDLQQPASYSTSAVSTTLEASKSSTTAISTTLETYPSYTGKALQFDGSQNYLSLGTMGSFGSNLGNGFYCKFNMKATSTASGEFGVINGPSTTAALIWINYDQGGSAVTNKISVLIRDDTNKFIQAGITNAYNFTDGKAHLIEIFITPATNTVVIKIDYILQPISYSTQTTPATFSNFIRSFLVGARNDVAAVNQFYACTIDNFTIGTLPTTLYGLYPENEGQGTVAKDYSGNNNDATLTGSTLPTWVTGLDPQFPTTALITTLETSAIKATSAVLTTLEAIKTSTTAIRTTLEKPPQYSTVAIATTLEATKLKTVALSTTLETYPGYTGKALQFDGSQNYVTLGTLGSLGSNLGSGFYVKFSIRSTQTTKWEAGMWHDPGVSAFFCGNEIGGGTQSAGHLRIGIEDNSSNYIEAYTTNATNFNDGNTHVIEMIVTTVSSTVVITIDGILQPISYQTQGTLSTFVNFSDPLYIGAVNFPAFGGASVFLSGTIDNLAIGTSAASLYAIYPFNEGQGTIAKDYSGSGNDATLLGSPPPTWVTGLDPQFPTTALLTTLETSAIKSTSAVFTNLELIKTSTTALRTTLELVKNSTAAVYTALEATKLSTTALSTTFETAQRSTTTALLTTLERTGKNTTAIISLLEATKNSTTAVTVTLEKAPQQTTESIFTLLESHALFSTVALQTVLETNAQKNTAAVSTTLESVIQKNTAGILTTLEKNPQYSTTAIITTLEASTKTSTTALATTLESAAKSATTALNTILEETVKSTAAIFTNLVLPTGSGTFPVAVLTTLEVIKQSTTAISITLEQSAKYSTTAVTTTLETSGKRSVLLNGLLSYYTMDGNSNDSIGSANGTDTSMSYVAGKINQGAFFGSSGSYIDLGNNFSFERTDAFSVAFWIKNNINSQGQLLIGKINTLNAPDPGWAIEFAGGNVYFVLNAGATFGANELQTYINTSTVLPDNNLHFVVITYDGSSVAAGVKMYFDNVLQTVNVDSNTLTASILNSVTAKIGGIATFPADAITFMLDEIPIYKRVISSAEINVLWNTGKALQPPFLNQSFAIVTIFESAAKASTTGVLTTLETAIKKNTTAVLTTLEEQQFSTAAIRSSLEATKESTTAIFTFFEGLASFSTTALRSSLEATKESTTAISTTLEVIPQTKTAAVQTTLEGNKRSTFAVLTALEIAPQASTTAVQVTLEGTGKNTSAITTTLETRLLFSTVGITTLLEKSGSSTLAIATTLQATQRNTFAVLVTLEVKTQQTTALQTLLNILAVQSVGMLTILEASTASTTAIATNLQQGAVAVIAIRTDLQAYNPRVAISTTLQPAAIPTSVGIITLFAHWVIHRPKRKRGAVSSFSTPTEGKATSAMHVPTQPHAKEIISAPTQPGVDEGLN